VRYTYSARLLPIGRTVNVPKLDGTPDFSTFHEKSFEVERTSKRLPDLCVAHDRDTIIGTIQMLYVYRDWWCCDFSLDPALPNELECGQPVSVGLDVIGSGHGSPFLREISIVPRGAVKGAEITSRVALKPKPVEQKPQPTPDPARSAPAPVDVIPHDPRPVHICRQPAVSSRDRAEDAELRRRLDWLEKHTGRYDVEAVVLGLQRELAGPSSHDLAREYRVRAA
jgi:hypothetical protein